MKSAREQQDFEHSPLIYHQEPSEGGPFDEVPTHHTVFRFFEANLMLVSTQLKGLVSANIYI